MRVALTFDDGPSEWTLAILDLLEANDARASFFVLGCYIGGHEALIRRLFDDGHTIGVHGWSHERMSDYDSGTIKTILGSTADLIEQITGERPMLWRAPHFHRNQRINNAAREIGLEHVGATIDANDWSRSSPSGIAYTVKALAFDGCVVDLHDGIPPNGGSGTDSRQPTVDAVEILLEEDWEFVNLDALVGVKALA